MRFIHTIFSILFIFCNFSSFSQSAPSKTFNIIYTSDLHFGLVKNEFRGNADVTANDVNLAMVNSFASLPLTEFPIDGGVGQHRTIGDIDYLIITGDIANRQQNKIQSDRISWNQFCAVYYEHLNNVFATSKTPHIFLTAGNHDISNAIGYYKPLTPKTDASSYYGIAKKMSLNTRVNHERFNYNVTDLNYSNNIGGVHFVFLNIWPDSTNLTWLEKDLSHISERIPVIIFTHDPIEGVAYHFSGAKQDKDSIWKNKYEHLLPEILVDTVDGAEPTNMHEQQLLTAFLKKHPNIKAYFHGHENYTEMYDYSGTDSSLKLPVFRVDSPMKGNVSKNDESKLSYEIITIDPIGEELTVRECFWNVLSKEGKYNLKWGQSRTIHL